MATDLHQLLDGLRAGQADLRGLVETAGLELPTPAEGWDVRDTVAHLAGTDVEAVRAGLSPQEFLAGLEVVAADVEGLLTGQLQERRGLPASSSSGSGRPASTACSTPSRRCRPTPGSPGTARR